jgi:hypothetical protein
VTVLKTLKMCWDVSSKPQSQKFSTIPPMNKKQNEVGNPHDGTLVFVRISRCTMDGAERFGPPSLVGVPDVARAVVHECEDDRCQPSAASNVVKSRSRRCCDLFEVRS